MEGALPHPSAHRAATHAVAEPWVSSWFGEEWDSTSQGWAGLVGSRAEAPAGWAGLGAGCVPGMPSGLYYNETTASPRELTA